MPDTTAPALTALILPDLGTDLTGYYAYTTFRAGAKDDSSGVVGVTLTLDRSYTLNSGTSASTIEFSGPELSLPFSFSVAPGSSVGTYRVTQAVVLDGAGNNAIYSGEELTALGIQNQFAIGTSTTIDVLRPYLYELSIPAIIKTTGAGTPVTFGIDAYDAGIYGSDIAEAVVRFDRAFQTSSGPVDTLTFTPANADTGAFRKTLAITSDTASGAYNVTGVMLTDHAGNTVSYDAAALSLVGGNTHILVDDRSAPMITSLTAGTINLRVGGTNTPVRLTAFDAAGNLAQVELRLDHAVNYLYQGPRGSRSIYSSNVLTEYLYQGGFNAQSLDASTAPGTYTITQAIASDTAGNTTTYTTADLMRLGFSSSFTVTADADGPTLTTLSLPTVVQALASFTAVGVYATAADTGTEPLRAILHLDRGFRPGTVPATLTGYFAGSTVAFSSGVLPTTVGPDGRGSYNVTDLTLFDGAGNSTLYTAAHLQQLGFSTRFAVTVAVAGDSNGDGHGDILWRHEGGGLSVWQATGTGSDDGIRQSTYNASVDTSWSVSETFDMNGDGRADILWRNTNGNISVWIGTSTGFQQAAFNDAATPSSWRIAGAADLNGDGKGDILFRSNAGALAAWVSDGTVFTKDAYFHNPVELSWKIEGLADFNGDGRADILWRNDNGTLSIWNGTGSFFASASLAENSYFHAPIDRSWHIDGTGDFNGDGHDDILWRNDNGALSVWTGTATGFDESRFNSSVATNWHIAQVTDFNADGLSDILWRADDGALSVWHSNGETFQQNTYFDNSVRVDWVVQAHEFIL